MTTKCNEFLDAILDQKKKRIIIGTVCKIQQDLCFGQKYDILGFPDVKACTVVVQANIPDLVSWSVQR